MTKKKKARQRKRAFRIMLITAALAVAAAGVMTYTYIGGREPDVETPTEPAVDPAALTDYGSFVLSEGQLSYPLLPTEINGIVAELDPGGVFRFYEYAADRLVPCADVKHVNVSVECSSQNIPATVYYVERGGKTAGFGLFTTAISDANVKLYDYAFFKAVTMPQGYGNNRAMLLVDFDKDDFASDNKSYSEIFSWNPDNGKAERLTSDSGRTVDEYGRMRNDWAVMTDQLLKSAGGKRLYLSGRHYNLNTLTQVCDVLTIANTSAKPPKTVTGIAGAYLEVYDGGDTLVYLKEVPGGFGALKKQGGNETVVKTFEGKLSDYLLGSRFLLNKETLVLTEIASGREAKLKASVKNPVAFSMSPDGRRIVILGGGKTQTAVFYDLSSGESSTAAEEGIFSEEYTQIIWLQSDAFAAMAEKDGALVYRIFRF